MGVPRRNRRFFPSVSMKIDLQTGKSILHPFEGFFVFKNKWSNLYGFVPVQLSVIALLSILWYTCCNNFIQEVDQ